MVKTKSFRKGKSKSHRKSHSKRSLLKSYLKKKKSLCKPLKRRSLRKHGGESTNMQKLIAKLENI